MAQATPKKHVPPQIFSHLWRGLREVVLWSSALVALYLLVALYTYSPDDPGWTYSADSGPVNNAGGVVGAYTADVLFSLFGWFAYLLPLAVVYGGWVVYRERKQQELQKERPSRGLLLMRGVGLVLLVPAATGLLAMYAGADETFRPGGIVGESFNNLLLDWFNYFGASLLLLALFVSGVTLLTGLSWFWVMDVLGALTLTLVNVVWGWFRGRLAREEVEDDEADARGLDYREDGLSGKAGLMQRLSVLRPRWLGGRGEQHGQAEQAVSAEHGPEAPDGQRSAVQGEIQFGDRFGAKPEQPVPGFGDGFDPLPPAIPANHPAQTANQAVDDDDESEQAFSGEQETRYWAVETEIRTGPGASPSLESWQAESAEAIYAEPPEDRLRQAHENERLAAEQATPSLAFTHEDKPMDTPEGTGDRQGEERYEPVIHFPMQPPPMEEGEPILLAPPVRSSSPTEQEPASNTPTENVYQSLHFSTPSETLAPGADSLPASPPLSTSMPEPPFEKQAHRVEPGRQLHSTVPVAQAQAPAKLETPFPSRSLLDAGDDLGPAYTREALERLSRLLEEKLLDFRVKVQVVAVHPGPVITRFEMAPAPGVKVSRITNLSTDIARSLSVTRVRVVEVIPGKSTIGLEIPNHRRETVRLSEVFYSPQYDHSRSPLTLALGKDIGGKPVVVDLAKMPHLLVAGTTGSGKSVSVNAMILSLLFKARPSEVRLIMIDPKMLELSIYDGIPHLLAPVVTDMKEAAHALRWCVVEMERRYQLMAAMGVRNLKGYNKKVQAAIDQGSPIPDPTQPPLEGTIMAYLEPLPFIVVVVDELADLMMVVGKKIEELIARLAQKARAAGLHLILATQRPSVDVITGLIKANIPTRIAFQVSSKVDSRTILDQGGAEALLGMGDMLYLPPGSGIPIRIHGAFVDDHEVHNVVEELKATGETDYLEGLLEEGGTEVPEGVVVPGDPVRPEDETDVLYDQAVRIVTETRRASVSGVQRRLRIGYNRAARLVESMEQAGVVGPLQSNGSREVLAPPPVEA